MNAMSLFFFAPCNTFLDFYSTVISSCGSPNTYLLNHCQLCHTAASRSLGLLMPCPKPLYTISFDGTPLSCSPRYSSYAFGMGTLLSNSPCCINVGVVALLMLVMGEVFK